MDRRGSAAGHGEMAARPARGYTAQDMVTRALSAFLAFLRIAAGLSLIGPGLKKLGWFASPVLDAKLADWAAHPANALVAKYLAFVAPHHLVLARLVVIGE